MAQKNALSRRQFRQNGFDQSDLQQYMRNNLPWDHQVIDNDAVAYGKPICYGRAIIVNAAEQERSCQYL